MGSLKPLRASTQEAENGLKATALNSLFRNILPVNPCRSRIYSSSAGSKLRNSLQTIDLTKKYLYFLQGIYPFAISSLTILPSAHPLAARGLRLVLIFPVRPICLLAKPALRIRSFETHP